MQKTTEHVLDWLENVLEVAKGNDPAQMALIQIAEGLLGESAIPDLGAEPGAPEPWISGSDAIKQDWPLWNRLGAGSSLYTKEEIGGAVVEGEWRKFRPEGMGPDGLLPGKCMTNELLAQCDWLWRPHKDGEWALDDTLDPFGKGAYRLAKWPEPGAPAPARPPSAYAPGAHPWLSHAEAIECSRYWPLWECDQPTRPVFTGAEMATRAQTLVPMLWREFRPEGMGPGGLLPGELMTNELLAQCDWLWQDAPGFAWAPANGTGSGRDGVYRPAKWPAPR